MTLNMKYSFIFIYSLFFLSCSKNTETVQDKFNTRIVFHTPDEGNEYRKGDTIFIRAEITSDVSMHGFEILIHPGITGQSVSLKSKHTHGKVIQAETYWVADIDRKSEVQIEVVAAIDHLGNNLSAFRHIVCNP